MEATAELASKQRRYDYRWSAIVEVCRCNLPGRPKGVSESPSENWHSAGPASFPTVTLISARGGCRCTVNYIMAGSSISWK